MKYKAVIFDWEMTLFDSEKALQAFAENFFKDLGIEIKIEPKNLMLMTLNELIEKIKQQFPNQLEKMDKKELKTRAKKILEKIIDTFEFRGNFMRELKNIKIGIISNNSIEIIDMLVKKFGLDFDVMITDEEKKTDKKDELNYAMKVLKVKPNEMLFVTHNPGDIQSAKSLEIETCGLITRFHNLEEFKKEKPTYIINNIQEVINILAT